MGMFDFNGTENIKINESAGSFLKSGIHKVKFVSLEYITGTGWEAMDVKFNSTSGSGTHSERVFAPKDDIRKDNRFGGKNASPKDHFICKWKQILMAISPDTIKQIDAGTLSVSANSFKGFVTKLSALVVDSVGVETSIKLVPGKDNNVQFPGFPGSINKEGNLFIKNKFIGENLALTDAEIKEISNRSNAAPTKAADLNDLEDELSDTSSVKDSSADIDDLPF